MNDQCIEGVCAIINNAEPASVVGTWQTVARAESFDPCYDEELLQNLVIAGMRGRFYLSFGGHGPIPVRIDSDHLQAQSNIEKTVEKELDGKVLNKIRNSFQLKVLPGGVRLRGSWEQVLEFAGGESVRVTYQIRATRLAS